MREITFRAKKKWSDDWQEGTILPLENGDYEIFFSDANGKIPHAGKRTGAYVEPETVCQFTGAYDKNKNKIFENDIVKKPYKGLYRLYRILWSDTSGRYWMQEVMSTALYDFITWNCEVVGNIFDNPEMTGNLFVSKEAEDTQVQEDAEVNRDE